MIYAAAVAQPVAQVAHLAAGILEAGGYHGAVDVSLALVNVADSGSSYWYTQHHGIFPVASFPTYPFEEYRTTTRVMSTQLRTEATSIAARLARKLLRTARPPGTPDPLTLG